MENEMLLAPLVLAIAAVAPLECASTGGAVMLAKSAEAAVATPTTSTEVVKITTGSKTVLLHVKNQFSPEWQGPDEYQLLESTKTSFKAVRSHPTLLETIIFDEAVGVVLWTRMRSGSAAASVIIEAYDCRAKAQHDSSTQP
jgi:hypothetical protein